ncbi:MAG: peptidase domain-containing ABC transporter, partial [Bacteroidales bacterium]|nr:peptidase domain-containing ABC transporter [Bacteroidales bacterium]
PAQGLLKYESGQFLKSWLVKGKGIALLLEPTPEFRKMSTGNKGRRMDFHYLFRYLQPYKSFIVQILLAMLISSLLSMMLPFVTQSVVDIGIADSNLHFVVVMLIAQVVIILSQALNDVVKNRIMLHVSSRISISLISDFLSKLMRLPIAFFDSRKVGDIMQRIGDYDRIQSFLTGSVISMAMAFVSVIIYSIIMATYNLGILAVFIVGSAMYILWIIAFMKKRRKLDYMRFQEMSSNQSNLIQMISGMQEIKLNNCEKQKRWEWERIQGSLYKIGIKGLTLGQTQQVGSLCIEQTKDIIISFLSAKLVINGSMTLGMMMAMQYIIGQLNAPISQFISFIQSTQDAKISLERLSEINEKEDEEPEGTSRICAIPLDGDISFRDVSFQYDGPHSEYVLKGINLEIPSDKVTAIVGSSGSGKSTMVKLMLGFYDPVVGEVLLGGQSIGDYNKNAWRRECGVVMQEGFIFSDTILGNIAPEDEEPDMKRIREAMHIANIEDYVDSLPLGLYTHIGMDGHGLSTGQKQRILIARAAYKDAKYLFLDEATNSLDANNEKTIMERLHRLFRGKTVVVVAHRLSTVREADNIVVLEGGKIVEQGRHNELLANKGAYYELVRNQLELGDD